jgi:predicted GIY-YIG superfamily endonuclease
MITVNAIISELNVDISNVADLRFIKHNAGKCKYTKGLRPCKKLYRKLQPDWKAAGQKEIYLKPGVGKEFLRSLVP